MGQEVGCEAPGSASVNNWLLNRRRRARIDAQCTVVAGHRFWPMAGAVPADELARKARPAGPVLVSAAASLLLPLALSRAALDAPTLRPALETMLTLFALCAAWLLRAQFGDSRCLRDLLLLCGSLALGVTNLAIYALPAAADVRSTGYLGAAGLWGQLCVAGIFAAAAAAPDEKVVARAGHPVRITALLGLGPLATAVLVGLLMNALGLDPTARAGIAGRAVLPVLVLAPIGLLVYAAVLFTRQNIRKPDRVLTLLAVAAVLLAGGVLSHLSRRSFPGGQVDVGTVLRVMSVSLILWAAFLLERRVRARLARTAALAERRRVARDLHDGIAQDLAFIVAHGAQMAADMGEEHPVVVAARRALAVSRTTISALSDPAGATASEALHAVAHELRARFDIAIAVTARIDSPVASGVREHLSRIAREAIANAARHGQARNVQVSLQRAEGGIALRVIDDGCGIPVDNLGLAPEGFGLRSMRERAGALGGSLTVRRAPQGGTELEVLVP